MTFWPRARSGVFDIVTHDSAKAPRLVLRIVVALVGVLIVWASFARLDIVAVAEGKLVPQTYVKIVQPAESGIVKDILVREGDSVRAGKVLVRLDATFASADRRQIAQQLALKRLELRRTEAQLLGMHIQAIEGDDSSLLAQVRLDSEARQRTHLDQLSTEEALLDRMKRELGAAQELLTKLERTLPSYQESAAAYAKLADEKLIGRLAAEEKRREAIEQVQDLSAQREQVASLRASLQAQERRISQLRSAYRAQLQTERVALTAEISRLSEEAKKQGFREGLLELRAPQDGIVQSLATTTLGAVVQPGTVLVTLVPRGERLVAEVLIKNRDIGFAVSGQKVRVKLAAYPFTKYGMLEGTVVNISADASQSNDSTQREHLTAFKAVINLPQQYLSASGLNLPIGAGMQVSAEIHEGSRTVLEYLLSPVRRVASEAATER
jgi:hemolysin D